MENDIQKQIKELFTAIGAMVDMWNVAYKNFKSAGYSDEDATRQTAAFMQVLLGNMRGHSGNGEQK